MTQTNNNRTGLLIGLVLLGFGIGWAANTYLNQRTTNDNQRSKANSIARPELSATNNLPVSAQKDSSGDADEQESRSKVEARLLELIFSEAGEHQLTADRIIDYYKLMVERGDSPRQDKRLRSFLRGSPELNFALIDQFTNIDDPQVKMQLGLTLMINNSMQKPFLEPKLIEKIKQNEDRSEMLKLLGDWGLQSKSNLQYLQGELPYMDDPDDAAAAIRAIYSSSWVGRSALEPAVMQDLRETINEYRDSDEPQIRAAAVAAMRTIAPKQYRQKLLESFDDSSELVRREALRLYLNNPIKSSDLEDKLFENMQDSSLSYKERSDIAFGLDNARLSKQQQDVIKEVQKELREYLKSLSRAEQQALFAE